MILQRFVILTLALFCKLIVINIIKSKKTEFLQEKSQQNKLKLFP